MPPLLLRLIRIVLTILSIAAAGVLPLTIAMPGVFRGWGGVGYMINEITRDWCASNFSLKELTAKLGEKGEAGKIVSEMQPGGEVRFFYGPDGVLQTVQLPLNGYNNDVVIQNWPQKVFDEKPDYWVFWNEQAACTIHRSFRGLGPESVWEGETVFYYFTILTLAGAVVTLTQLARFFLYREESKVSARRSFILFFVLMGWLWGWWYVCRNGLFVVSVPESDCVQELSQLASEQRPLLDSLLQEKRESSFQPADFLKARVVASDKSFSERKKSYLRMPFYATVPLPVETHDGMVWVNRSSDARADYIRINCDFFNYIFYAPGMDLTQLAQQNHLISLRPLEKDFYWGSYLQYPTAMKALSTRLRLLWLLWLVMGAIHCGLLWWARPPRKKRKKVFPVNING